jgi:hypothetical protein
MEQEKYKNDEITENKLEIQNQRGLIVRNPLFICEQVSTIEETTFNWKIDKVNFSTAVWTVRVRVSAKPAGNRGETLQKFQTAKSSSILNQSERSTHHLTAITSHNHILYITFIHSTHLVQDMQDPHFWKKSKLKILNFYKFQHLICVCWGLTNIWEGRNDVQSLFAIVIVLVLVIHSAFAFTEIRTFDFPLCTLAFDVCFWMFASTFDFHPFAFFAWTFHKLLAILLAFNVFAFASFLIRLRIYLWVREFVEQAVLRLVELRLCKLVWIRFLVLFFGYLEFAFVWFIDIQCNWTTEFCLSILL